MLAIILDTALALLGGLAAASLILYAIDQTHQLIHLWRERAAWRTTRAEINALNAEIRTLEGRPRTTYFRLEQPGNPGRYAPCLTVHTVPFRSAPGRIAYAAGLALRHPDDAPVKVKGRLIAERRAWHALTHDAPEWDGRGVFVSGVGRPTGQHGRRLFPNLDSLQEFIAQLRAAEFGGHRRRVLLQRYRAAFFGELATPPIEVAPAPRALPAAPPPEVVPATDRPADPNAWPPTPGWWYGRGGTAFLFGPVDPGTGGAPCLITDQLHADHPKFVPAKPTDVRWFTQRSGWVVTRPANASELVELGKKLTRTP